MSSPSPAQNPEFLLFILLKSDQETEVRWVPLRFADRESLESTLLRIHGAVPFGDRVFTLRDSWGKELRYRLDYFRGYYWTSPTDFVW